jgi:hypothetical protein
MSTSSGGAGREAVVRCTLAVSLLEISSAAALRKLAWDETLPTDQFDPSDSTWD